MTAEDALAAALHSAEAGCWPDNAEDKPEHHLRAAADILAALPAETRADGHQGRWRLTLWWDPEPAPPIIIEEATAYEALLVRGVRPMTDADRIAAMTEARLAEAGRARLREVQDEASPFWRTIEAALWPHGPAKGSASGAYAAAKACGSFHIERMDRDHVWIAVSTADGRRLVVNLRAKGRITMTMEARDG
jgi:hypothetical protein